MTDDERTIRDVVETWMAATKRGDLATVLSLMGITAVLVLYEMLTRDGVLKTAATGVFATMLIAILVLDVAL